MQAGFILLENGEIFSGQFTRPFPQMIEGEIVFNTSMTGYQEIMTDPSYAEQIVTLTYPLIGTYGSSRQWSENNRIFAKCLVVKEYQKKPNHFQNEDDFDEFLAKQSIPILQGIDTRDLTKIIRNYGVMKAVIGSDINQLKQKMLDLKKRPPQLGNEIELVSTKKSYQVGKGKYHVVVIDFGVKSSMLDDLLKRDVSLTVYLTTQVLKTSKAIIRTGLCYPMDLATLWPWREYSQPLLNYKQTTRCYAFVWDIKFLHSPMEPRLTNSSLDIEVRITRSRISPRAKSI